MLKKILITTVLTASTCTVINANAALPMGFYVSGQVGYADSGIKSRLQSLPGIILANDGLAGRVALGYKITPKVALEVGYMQLRSAQFNDEDEQTSASNEQNAIDIAAKGILPITSNVNIYGKLGIAYLTTQIEMSEEGGRKLDPVPNIAKRTFAPEVAVGMAYDITPNVSVDTSLTHIQTLGSRRPGNIDFLAVGVAYNFG